MDRSLKESKNITFYILALIVLLLLSHNLEARPFYDDRAKGWHWYEIKQLPETQVLDNNKDTPVTPEQAKFELEQLQLELEGAKALAVMYPTSEHVSNYIELHNAVIQRASLFSSIWQQVVWQTPSLDFSINNPTDNSARHVHYDVKTVSDAQMVESLSNEYGLFFFFKESCQYCHAFAPVLKNFENKHNLTVMAVSLDGGSLPEYPNAQLDNGMAAELGVEVVPAVYAVHPRKNHVIPISHGFVSEAELLRRMSTLANKQGELQ